MLKTKEAFNNKFQQMTKYLYGKTSFYALGIDVKVLVDMRIYFSTGSNLHHSKIINNILLFLHLLASN